MTRTLKVKDYGKDYGQGRYVAVLDSGKPDEPVKWVGSNEKVDIALAMIEWLEERGE